uniref:NADH dehydrogenase subunit 5 n=1 Tax=Panagrolaimus sp. PS1159 TaxID=55785 RepID=A0AC35F126_9BILA
MSWFAIIYAIVILLLPLGKTYIAGEDSPEQWRLFFYIGAAIALVTLVFWFFTTDVDLRSWAIIQKKPSIVSVITFDTKDGGLFNLKRG